MGQAGWAHNLFMYRQGGHWFDVVAILKPFAPFLQELRKATPTGRRALLGDRSHARPHTIFMPVILNPCHYIKGHVVGLVLGPPPSHWPPSSSIALNSPLLPPHSSAGLVLGPPPSHWHPSSSPALSWCEASVWRTWAAAWAWRVWRRHLQVREMQGNIDQDLDTDLGCGLGGDSGSIRR